MKLEETIKHCLEVANRKEMESEFETDCVCYAMTDKEREEYKKCAADHRQLAEWLTELKGLREENKVLTSECDRLIKEKGELLKKSEQIAEYKRLLKAAVEDIYYYVDCYEAHCDECCCDHDNHCHWKHEAEALALIGEEENP